MTHTACFSSRGRVMEQTTRKLINGANETQRRRGRAIIHAPELRAGAEDDVPGLAALFSLLESVGHCVGRWVSPQLHQMTVHHGKQLFCPTLLPHGVWKVTKPTTTLLWVETRRRLALSNNECACSMSCKEPFVFVLIVTMGTIAAKVLFVGGCSKDNRWL